MLWSGGLYGFTNDLSNRRQRYITIGNTLMGYPLGDFAWCGNKEGINHDACPSPRSCKKNNFNYSLIFWERASEKVSIDSQYG